MVDYTKLDYSNAVTGAFADYDKTKEPKQDYKVDLKKYFSPSLAEGETSGEKQIRILPSTEDPMDFFITKNFQNLLVGGKYQKLYDPAQDGDESPLSELAKQLYADAKEEKDETKAKAIKKIANNYLPRKFYILRVIERGKENEGVKYWRINHVTDGTGVLDKIKPLVTRLNNKEAGLGAIWQPIRGRDLILSLGRDSKGYTKILTIQTDDVESPISQDEKQMTDWLNDPTTWRDVYKKKPIEYLRIVAEGGTPTFNKEAGTFIAKIENDEHNSASEPQSAPAPQAQDFVPQEQPELETNTSPVNVDDLPF